MKKKQIYLDIDMDYFVEPIEKVSVDNIRLFHDKTCTLRSTAPLMEGLKTAGLRWRREDIHGFTNHKKSYIYWWMKKNQGCTVIHIDAHSDLYRNNSRDLRKLSNGDMGCYNYLWYAIRDGYADEIYWVIPDSIKDTLDTDKADTIINKALIQESFTDEAGLHIHIGCIDIFGMEKTVKLHVCTVEKLPRFDAFCEKVTIATSPEFIPEKADDLVYEIFDAFGAGRDISDNIFKQHKDLLKKSEEEIEEARKKLNLL